MRYRKLSSSGDMQFGHGVADFWFNVPDAVGQAVKTRLLLFKGEWFADTTEGTPWGGFPLNGLVVAQGTILGKGTQAAADMAIKERVVSTPGVTDIQDYSSSFDSDRRSLTISMRIDTVYGGQLTVGPLMMSGFLLGIGGSPIGGGQGL